MSFPRAFYGRGRIRSIESEEVPLTGIEFYGEQITEAGLMNMMGLSNAIYAVNTQNAVGSKRVLIGAIPGI